MLSHFSVKFVSLFHQIKDHDPKNMMSVSPPLPPMYNGCFTTTSPPPPPIPAKRFLQLDKMDDGEDFQLHNLFFPSLDDKGEVWDKTTSAVVNDPMEDDDIVCLCSLTETINSPLSVGKKFATRRVLLKPRFSRNEAIMTECSLKNTSEAKKLKFTESYETQDLPKLPSGSKGTIFRNRKQVSARGA